MTLTTSLTRPGQPLPLVIHPGPDTGTADLTALARTHRDALDAALAVHGALLFRGFGIDSPRAMADAAAALCDDLFDDNGEHAHDAVIENVYTPVEYASTAKLLWHTENSFNHRWPSRLLFAAAQPARTGGQTPLVDNRQVWRALDPRQRALFTAAGVAYTRSYGTGLGLDWQQVFRTGERAAVERHLTENLFSWQWLDGDGDEDGGLRTRARRPAAVRHPVSGEACWFAQLAHWHPACLDPQTREALVALYGEDDLPRDCSLGDGRPITDEDMAALAGVYERFEVSFDWERGDLLLVDNIAVSHARQPFTGERMLLVALGDMMSFADVEAVRVS